MNALSGKRAVVVGAAGAYAAVVVRTLRAEGVIVAALDPSEEALRRLAADMTAEVFLRCDTSDGGVASALAALEARGHGMDILVTCPPALAETPGQLDGVRLRELLASTLEPAFLWTTAAARTMRPRRAGSIVHLTGLSGLGGWRGWEGAGAAFAGVHSLTRSFALDLAATGVRVNALVPGVSPTLGERIARSSGQSLEAVRARIPLARFMPEEALGNALVYLLHPSSSYVTGEVLAVDGGWDMWGRLHAVAAT